MRRASGENSPFASEIFIISIRSILSPSSYYHPSFHCFPLFLIPLSYYPTKHYFPLLTPFISGLCEKVSCVEIDQDARSKTYKCPPLHISIPSTMISYTYFYDVTTPHEEKINKRNSYIKRFSSFIK